MTLTDVYEVVDRERERYVEELRRLIRQPSISSQGIGVRECGLMLVEMLERLGVRARLLETAGQPAVFGEVAAARPDAPTLLIYSHYDVQPPEPLEAWEHPPFEAVLVGDRIVARGATDAKGNVMAIVKALDAYRAAGEPLPLNIKFIFDGEEESGSPNLPAAVQEHRELLMADAVLGMDGGADPSGRPRVQMGSSGLAMLTLRCRTAEADLHSSRARLVMNPAWRLVWALASMKGPDDEVTIKGFYDDVLPPTPQERQLLEEMGWDDEVQKQALGVTELINNVSGVAALERLLYRPTLNINSFKAGHLGEGHRTVLPAEASVTLDLRLVPRQTPEKAEELVRAHLREHGYDDVTVEGTGGGIPPSWAPLDSPIVRAVVDSAETLYGGAAVKPRGEASGKSAGWLGMQLGIPAATSNVGPPAWKGHAPNEFITLDRYLTGIKYLATIWARYAEEQRGGAR
jgi:acetylornithine deacetylase/succinyl-diaminopimelate desuccinylase-like protein